ncbi:MAG: SNF2 helicase associated domain-containing protein [Bacilli bacterium]
MDKEVIDSLKQIISGYDIEKGLNYNKNCIELIETTKNNNITSYLFNIESQHTYKYYDVQIKIVDNHIYGLSCTCPQYQAYRSCKHIAACAIKYSSLIFNKEEVIKNSTFTLKSNDFISYLKSNETIKKELNLEISFTTSNNYYHGIYLEYDLKIGDERLYKINSKLSSFISAYTSESPYILNIGAKLQYNNKDNYFNEINEKIINIFIRNRSYFSSYNGNFIDEDILRELLELLEDKPFKFNDIKINKIHKGLPSNINFTKDKDDKYLLSFDFIKDIKWISNNSEYIFIYDSIYKLNKEEIKLIIFLLTNKYYNCKIEKDELPNFSSSLLPVIRNNIVIDKSVDIILPDKPQVQLYFDLQQTKIVCNPKFIYNDISLYLYEENSLILRDTSYENSIVEELLKYDFVLINKVLVLTSIDKIGSFIEFTLEKLSSKYKIFTSKKIDNMKPRKTAISSSFSIGKDNIMKYDFSLGDVSPSEIDKILNDLKDKKKYYKLKNGSIIKLEDNENLIEFNSLIDDMSLSKKDLTSSSGVIPKYRAIYLDSLKDTKYSIIKTNNLFDNFIETFKKYKDISISFTPKESKILRDYQKEAVKWLYNIYKTGLGGVLADEMGLGKSIESLYFIKEVLKEDTNAKFLIVCPKSLVYNWENEIQKFTKNITYKTLSDNKINRRSFLENIKLLNKTSILITTYAMLREDIEYYKNISFAAMFIDEAQNIKNPNALITESVKEINAKTKYALTGTPVENSCVELWSIFDYAMPGFLASQKSFERKYKVKEFDEETNELLSNLNTLVRPFILRRKKKDVLKDLPLKQENNIFIDLNESQKKLYAVEIKRANKQLDEIIEEGGVSKARFLILKLLTKLRQLCIDPRILFENYDGGSTKMDELIKIVKELIENEHKILLFSSYKTALNLVKEEFDKESITYYTIDGSVSAKKRMEMATSFNKDNTNVFLIMLKSGGTGLNLVGADTVIHLDMWWNPQAENQATDRAHRIGQKNNVQVIKLICKGTIEEKILKLQEKKKVLSDKLLESDQAKENLLSSLTEKDIKNLLSYENNND